MTALAEAFVSIRADTTKMPEEIKKGTTDAIGKTQPALTEQGKRMGGHLSGGMRSALSGIGGSLLAGFGGGLLAGGIAQIGGSLVGLVGDARAAASAARITEQVIKTTGGAAHVTAAQIDDLSTSISNKTGVDDDAVRASANMLLTFTSVRNEVGKGNDIFNQATATITDMSVALGQDGKSSAIQLGKALNDPIKGITALQRVGVSFTDDQKKQIATLVKHGNVLGAQKVILKELGHEFGGAAAAASDPMKKLGVTLSNTGKELAANLLPALNAGATFISGTFLPAVMGTFSFIGDHLPVFAGLAAAVGVATLAAGANALAVGIQTGALSAWITSTTVAKIAMGAAAAAQWLWNAAMTANPIGLIVVAIAAVVGALILAYNKVGWFRAFVDAAWGAVVKAFNTVRDAMGGLWGKMQAAFAWVGEHWGTILAVITGPFGIAVKVIHDHWDTIVGTVQAIPGRIATAVSGMWDGLKNGFRAALNWIIDRWNSFPKMEIPGIDIGPIHYGGGTIGLPPLPHLAQGGVVPATRGGRLIVAGEGGEDEIVAPESKLRSMLGARSGDVNITINAPGADAGTVQQLRDIARDVVYNVAREALLS